MPTQMRTLTVRQWMLVGMLIFVLSAAIFYHIAGLFDEHLSRPSTWQVQQQASALAGIQRSAATDVASWGDPAWQAAFAQTLDRLNVGAALVDASGRTVFSGGPVPRWGTAASTATVLDGCEDAGSIRLFLPRSDDWVAPLGALLSLVTALLFVRWQMGRYLVRPLEAMAAAARQIADGNLEFELPETRVREVSEVSAAFQAMAEGLRVSVRRQSELEEQRRFFIGAVAHDLRTPLFALRGYLTGLEQGLASSPEKAASYIAVCRQKADQLERLVEDLFAYTRSEYLGQTLRHEPVDLSDLLVRTAAGFRARADAQDVEIHLDGPRQVCMFLGDEDLIERAVSNLLDNALRHTRPGGSIDVCWSGDEQRATFTIVDSGSGIAERDLPHLFEPFYRGEASRNSKTGGAGLGLSIAKRVLQAHGGDLVAANRSPGGAQFSGWLARASSPLLPLREKRPGDEG